MEWSAAGAARYLLGYNVGNGVDYMCGQGLDKWMLVFILWCLHGGWPA